MTTRFSKTTQIDTEIADDVTVVTWYDEQTRDYVTQLKTNGGDGAQIGKALFDGTAKGARASHEIVVENAVKMLEQELEERDTPADAFKLKIVASVPQETKPSGSINAADMLVEGLETAMSGEQIVAVELTRPQAEWVEWALDAMTSADEDEQLEKYGVADVSEIVKLEPFGRLVFKVHPEKVDDATVIANIADDLYYRLETQSADIADDGIGNFSSVKAAKNAAAKIKEPLARYAAETLISRSNALEIKAVDVALEADKVDGVIDGSTFTGRVIRAEQLAKDGNHEDADRLFKELDDELSSAHISRSVFFGRVAQLSRLRNAIDLYRLTSEPEIKRESTRTIEELGVLLDLVITEYVDGSAMFSIEKSSTGEVITASLPHYKLGNAIADGEAAARRIARDIVGGMIEVHPEPIDDEYISHEHGFADDREHEKSTLAAEIIVRLKTDRLPHEIDEALGDEIDSAINTVENVVTAALSGLLDQLEALGLEVTVEGPGGEVTVQR